MTEFILCADFNLFPDGYEFNPTFLLSGYSFVKLGDWLETTMAVKEETVSESESKNPKERGLRFPQEGIEITLPTPVNKVIFRLRNDSRAAKLECLDASGNITEETTIPSIFRYVDFQIAAPKISSLKITGGEVAISQISIAVCVTG